jgi:hypothetical protein
VSDDAQTAVVLAQLAATALTTALAVVRLGTPRRARTDATPGPDSRALRWSLDLFVAGAVVVIAFVALDAGVAAPLAVGLAALTLAFALVPVAVHARSDRS